MTLTGSLTVAGRAPPAVNEVTTTAKGAAESSGSAAIGVALALSIANHDVSGTLQRSVTAGHFVLIEAIGRSRVISDSTASATGAPGEGDEGAPADDPDGEAGPKKGGVDGQVQGERDQANKQSTTNGGSGTGSKETPTASSSNGPIAVAAAVSINVATSNSLATIADGLVIIAGESVTVRSSANSDAKTIANGNAVTPGTVGIGAAVAVNLLTVTNARDDRRHHDHGQRRERRSVDDRVRHRSGAPVGRHRLGGRRVGQGAPEGHPVAVQQALRPAVRRGRHVGGGAERQEAADGYRHR